MTTKEELLVVALRRSQELCNVISNEKAISFWSRKRTRIAAKNSLQRVLDELEKVKNIK